MNHTNALFPLALSLIALGGCSDDGPEKAITNQWNEVGIDTTSLEARELAGLEDAQECRRGPIEGLEVSLCRFETPEEAAKAKHIGLTIVGPNTGVSLVSASHLLVVVDRTGADPHGKLINELAKTFQVAAPTSTQPTEEDDKPKDVATLYSKAR